MCVLHFSMCDRSWYKTWWRYCGSRPSSEWGWTNRLIDRQRSMSSLSSATSMVMPWGRHFCRSRRWPMAKPRRCMTAWHLCLHLTTFLWRRYALLHLLTAMMMLNCVQFTAQLVVLCCRSSASAWTVRVWCSAKRTVWPDCTRRSWLLIVYVTGCTWLSARQPGVHGVHLLSQIVTQVYQHVNNCPNRLHKFHELAKLLSMIDWGDGEETTGTAFWSSKG